MTANVAIIILNWNGRIDTLACLDSVSQINYPRLTVVVADNGSNDGSPAAIQQAHPNVEIIENHANLGFAAGNNRAISYALERGAEFILLLNNDTVVDADILSEFLKAETLMPQVGIFGAKIYHYDRQNVLWYAGGYWNQRTLSFEEYGAGEKDCGQFDTMTETEWVIGCAMFVRAEVFRAIGLLEPRYFLNGEEVDFCCRAKEAGFSCAYVPTARLWHKISVSFGGEFSPLKEYFSTRNRLLWAKRNTNLWLRAQIHVRSASSLIRRFTMPFFRRATNPRFSLRERWWSAHEAFADPRSRAAALGFHDFWLGRFGNCPEIVRKLNADWVARQKTLPPALTDSGTPH